MHPERGIDIVPYLFHSFFPTTSEYFRCFLSDCPPLNMSQYVKRFSSR
jgi:hypothetical protein